MSDHDQIRIHRAAPDVWQEAGGADMWARAKRRVREILKDHHPDHRSAATDCLIRDRLPIRLPREALFPGAAGGGM